MKNIILTFLGVFVASLLAAQSIENIRVKSLSLDSVQIIYDLTGLNKNEETFKIDVYSSHNGFTIPLSKVSGSVGNNVLAGKNKQIIWLSADELGSFEGNLSFKLKASLESAPWIISSPRPNSGARRGKNLTLAWSGMNKGAEFVKIEILDKKLQSVVTEQTVNNGNYKIRLPNKMKTGLYELKVSNAAGSGQANTIIKIKNKTPLALKLSPILLLGGVAAILSSSSKKSDSPTPSTSPDPVEENLPAPQNHP